MKVIFICGSLEPGKDGVGDYTRRLAGELIRKDHSAEIIALEDLYVREIIKENQKDTDTIIPTLRLPARTPLVERKNIARQYIEEFHPEFLSLQYVPYSFNKKGVPVFLANKLSSWAFTDIKWHIMFHELWIDTPQNLVQFGISILQRHIVKKMVSTLSPVSVSVTIPYNQRRLKKMEIQTEIIELFGNIPNSSKVTMSNNYLSDRVSILYFGTAPRDKFADLIINKLEEFCSTTSYKISLVLVSGQSATKEQFKEKIKNRLSRFDFELDDLGFAESEVISDLFKRCNVGIARSEAYLIGKSGAAIAMLEHGLPIWMPKLDKASDLEIYFRKDLIFSDLKKAVDCSFRPPYLSRLNEISEKFLSQLK